MASHSAIPCDHELRPGTTVCLRCQHAERGAKRARQRRLLARGGAATLALGMIVAVGIGVVTAWRGRAGAGRQLLTIGDVTRMPSGSATAGDTTAPTAVVPATGIPVSTPSTASLVASPAPAPTPPLTPPTIAAVSPVIPVGRTMLRDTIVAERMGDTVRVSFDLLLSRTRRPDKFEAIMRSTLPQVFGPAADSALRSLPAGSVARAGDLVATLPERGLRIPAAGGMTIAVWPETRLGRDGPLVVAYRALASR
jgi:hypothetical protein